MKNQLKVLALVVVVGLTGCAGGGGARDYSEMLYLRGQFAWWDALDEYKVKKVGNNLYKSTVELTADGQPYEMKFGDAAWSAGTNCGYLSQEEDQNLEFGKKSKANCSSIFENFKFLPAETGNYDVYIDFGGDVPLVWVEKAS